MTASPPEPLSIAVLGDLHGHLEAARDAPLLRRHALALCTGDLPPNHGRGRFDEALRQARELAALGVLTVLGNHDGPTAFTGRRFPKSYLRLAEELGACHVGGARADRPDLDLSVVGARPLTVGGPALRFPVPGREDWSLERWAEETAALVAAAPCSRVVVLAHCGPTGAGVDRAAPWGRDFGGAEGDWGDPDLRLAMDRLAAAGRSPVAVIAGHMHHRLQGGGLRRPVARAGGVLLVNAATWPRVDADGRRALTVVELRGHEATAFLEWHSRDGTVARRALEPGVAAGVTR